MSRKQSSCPACGANATGKFCNECGAPLARKCPSCGTQAASPSAKYCQECGAALGGSRSPDSTKKQPAGAREKTSTVWLLVAAAGVALAVIGGIVILERRDASVSPAASGTSSRSSIATTSLVDISTMSPEEAASRLFNRIMMASESGNAAEAKSFVPMALAAYEQLGALGPDESYHVGLIYMVAEDLEGAKGRLGAIRDLVPTHLMGYMLAHSIAEAEGDAQAMREAFDGFLSVLADELAAGRAEYQHHGVGITGFRDRAEAAARESP